MTASEECAERCDAASGLERGAVPIAAWILLIQFAAQLLSTCYADSGLAARTLRQKGFDRRAAVRRLKREARRAGVPPRLRQRAAETVLEQSVRHATSGLLTAIWHDEMVAA